MRIVTPTLELTEGEGFSNDKDIFERASLARGLTRIVAESDSPLVLAIDGAWGSGKSVFLKMWAAQLRAEHFPVVFFDAFENDHSQDAFTALAAHIIALAKSKSGVKGKVQGFIDRSVVAGTAILRSGMKLGANALAKKLLSADLEEIKDEFAELVGELEDKLVAEQLLGQREKEHAINEFRKALSSLPALLNSNVGKDHNPTSRPLVFIIDELDRCRPSFALEVLERVKHFFTVPNVHFVLGVHLGQLGNAVKLTYGCDDPGLYLQKFIHLTVRLPDGSDDVRRSASTRYLEFLRKLHWPENKGEAGLTYVDNLLDLVQHAAHQKALSLRVLERIVSTIVLAHTFARDADTLNLLVSSLCILKVLDPPLYERIRRGERVELGEVASAIGVGRGGEHIGASESVYGFLDYCLTNTQDENLARFFALNQLRGKSALRDIAIRYVDGKLSV